MKVNEEKVEKKKTQQKKDVEKNKKTIEQKKEELFKPVEQKTQSKKEKANPKNKKRSSTKEKTKNQNKKETNKNTNKKETKKGEKKEHSSKQEKTESEFRQVKKPDKKIHTHEKKRKISVKTKVISGIVIAAIILIMSTIFAILNINNSNILKGVSIKGIDVSNLSKTDAMNKLEQIYNDKLGTEIEVQYQDYESTVDLNLLETKYEIEKAVDEAVQTGKNSNIFVNNYQILATYLFKKDINLEATINEEIANQTIEDIGAKLPGIVVESSYYIEDDNLIIGKGKTGVVIDKEKMLNMVKDEINKTEKTQEVLEIPVQDKDPEPVDIDKIHSEVYKEVKDAYITKDPFEVHPEVDGIDFDVEEAKKILAEEEKDEYIIPLKVTKAKVTLSQMGDEAFPDRLSTFTTKYDASNGDRTTNLRIACQKINGKVILPGETFSYNKTLGKRTAEAGYRNGKIYENGQVVDGIGGGICQISSTLYNTVLMANLEIVERRNHQFVTSYLPAGRDATVVYGATDFRFKNTRKYPVRLSASINNGVATVSMYGIKEDEEYTVSFSTKTISTVPPTTKYEEDSSLPSGTEKVKQAGSNGLVTETYITKKLGNKVVSTKLLSRDTYSAMQKIVLRGTGAASTTTTPSTPVQSQPQAPRTQPSTAPQTTETDTSEDPDSRVSE